MDEMELESIEVELWGALHQVNVGRKDLLNSVTPLDESLAQGFL